MEKVKKLSKKHIVCPSHEKETKIKNYEQNKEKIPEKKDTKNNK